MLAMQPATMAGGNEVVKMNPGAKERMVSINEREAAMYSPIDANGLRHCALNNINLI